MFSAIFISKPKMAMVISLVLTILGAIGFATLPVEQ
jgi:HAE1 family hydrophobic/amphiphilic exporter-1